MPRARKGSTAPDPLIGRVISDRFRVVSLIARGGMGKVYRAEQAPLGRAVALKVLQPSYAGDQDPEFHKRFFLEASICARLTHPNTVTIFDYGRTEDDIYFIAMELLEGRTLQAALREERPLAPARALHIAAQICRSLREAHAMGVIHRDLKPANIFLVRHDDDDDFVKVLDFGLVKDIGGSGEDLTETGLFMGSPKYMSPEQIRGEPVDWRSDVYSLGVILYEMLAGSVPFSGPNSVNILMAHVQQAPPSLAEAGPAGQVPPALERVVMRALAKRPEERHADMDELLDALQAASSEDALGLSRSDLVPVGLAAPPLASPPRPVPAAAPPPGPLTRTSIPPPPGEAPSRGPAIVAALVLIGALAAAALIALGMGAMDRESPPSAPGVAAGGAGSSLAEGADASSHAGAASPDGRTGTEAPDTDTEQRPPAPPRVLLALRSEPPGALVTIGDREYGPTPTDVELTGDAAAPGAELTLLFRLARHHDFTVTRRVRGERMEVTARMEPVRTRPYAGRPGEGVTSRPSVGLKGYKAEPY